MAGDHQESRHHGAISMATFDPAALPHPLAAVLAPTGRLRAAINLANPVLCSGGRDGGEPRGLAADLARALAQRLGVPVALLPQASAKACVDIVQEEAADIGFFAIDPMRAGMLHFTPPYVQMEGVYVVPDSSALRSNEQVDAAGVRVAVGAGSAYALHLERVLKQAQVIQVQGSGQVVAAFAEQGLEAAAGVRQQMQADMAKWPGLRMLPGRFMAIYQSLATSRRRSEEACAFLNAFVEDAKASGLAGESLARHGVQGATVAVPGYPKG